MSPDAPTRSNASRARRSTGSTAASVSAPIIGAARIVCAMTIAGTLNRKRMNPRGPL
jgi:hypothetical protein